MEKKDVLEQLDPFLFGGDMVQEVREGKVNLQTITLEIYSWTPNILGTIASGHGINFSC